MYLLLAHLAPPEDSRVAEDAVVALDRSVFDQPMRKDILHLCVNFYRDDLRQGTASAKTRAEVHGSGRKLRPQKGTGRARLGDKGSPMLRGGGVAFAPKPRSFATELPRKVRQLGMRVALSAKLREQGLGVVESIEWPGLRTGDFYRRLKDLGWEKMLFISSGESIPPRLERVSRNIQTVGTKMAKDVEVYDLLQWPRVVMDIGSVDYFQRLLGTNVAPEERIRPFRRPTLRWSRMMAGQVRKKSPAIPGGTEISDKSSGDLFES